LDHSREKVTIFISKRVSNKNSKKFRKDEEEKKIPRKIKEISNKTMEKVWKISSICRNFYFPPRKTRKNKLILI
jgi:hypothetical protein